MDTLSKCYVIAEAGLNHNGSLDIAKKLIDVASIAGVDAVKFQKRTVEKLAIGEVLDAEDVRFPEFGKTYREIRNHLEFDFDQYIELRKYTKQKNLDFMVTAFDIDAVDFLIKVDIDAFKLASHSLTNIELLTYLAEIKKPIILSTGMADIDEIDRAVSIFNRKNATLKLMHCVSAYPTPIDQCNLNMVDVLRKRYALPVGYSGHEMGFLPTMLAVARGAELIERHFTLDKTMVGFDHKISLEPDELIAMTRQIRALPSIIGDGQKKVSDAEWVTRRKYHVSAVSSNLISKGTVLTESMVTYRNPGTGIPAKLVPGLLGKTAKCDIPADSLLSFEMFD
jgi:sialic acid synthase SpsE